MAEQTMPGGRHEPSVQAQESTRLGARRADDAAGATQLGARSAGSGAATPAASVGTQTGQGGQVHGGDVVQRFGPGVPTAASPTAGSPAWTAVGTARRRRGWIGGLLTLLLLAGVIAYLLSRQANPLQVSGASVAAAAEPGTSCDVTVDVVGTVTTNGRGGTVSYQWLRSDGEQSEVLSQSVADGATSTQVHLQWTFSGRGSFPAKATLRVVAPNPTEAVGGFTYACR